MKKGLISFILIAVLLAAGISYAATCSYDADFDLDGDYIMNSGADCGPAYRYDCDDSDKDVFRDCGEDEETGEKDSGTEEQEDRQQEKLSWWQRFKAWLRGDSGTTPTGNTITSITSRLKEKIVKKKASEPACEPVTICYTDDLKEIHCPLDYDECCGRYSDCRMVECDAGEECEEPAYAEQETYNTEETCSEEYHDCFDDGEAIICKGEFSRCAEAFDSCTCGTDDGADYEAAEPDIDSRQEVECDTGVFVCRRQTVTMDGNIADSTVTCKGSFSECSMVYGNCVCGNSSLTDFPTQRIGVEGTGPVDDEDYWCEHLGKQVPCSRLPENCNLKKHTCDKGNGVMINCEGTIGYCNKKYDNTCLCGIESISSGFMKTSDE